MDTDPLLKEVLLLDFGQQYNVMCQNSVLNLSFYKAVITNVVMVIIFFRLLGYIAD